MSTYAIKFISGRYQGGKFPVPEHGELLIGRSSDLDLVLVEDMVSRKHAKIVANGKSLSITDLGSTNGSFVNGEKIRRAELKRNDRILIGTSILKVIDGSELTDGPQDRESIKTMMEELAVRAPKSSTMSGDLEEVPLPDLLQLFASNQKSGVLVISGANKGKIYVKDGQLHYAVITGQVGMHPNKAIGRMIAWEKGSFRLEPYEENAEFSDTFSEPTESILMEAMRQVDEMKRLYEDLPSSDAEIGLCLPMAPKLRDLSADELDTLQLALNFGTVQQVIDKTPKPDFDAVTNLHKLFKEGYLEETL